MEWIPIRVLLYKAKIDGKVIDNVIAEWTWFWNGCRRRGLTEEQAAMLFKWSHAELWTPDEKLISFGGTEEDPDAGMLSHFFFGDCWTSTMGAIRDKTSAAVNGTVCRPAFHVLRHPERWSVSDDIWLPKQVFEDLLYYMNKKARDNKGYDKRAIASYGTPWRFHDKGKEICSEHVHDDLIFAAQQWQHKNIISGDEQYPCTGMGYFMLINYMQLYSPTPIPSPLLLGMNLIKSGVSFRDLAT